MVQDKSNDLFADNLNVTATAKLAKITAEAIQMGVADPVQGAALIRKIAANLLTNVPRVHGLWPHHHSMNGGTQIGNGTRDEYASGDTWFTPSWI